jgi:hypothetical protein
MHAHQTPEELLPEERRKEVFRALADAQDLQELTPPQACKLIAKRFGISENQARQIEREGQEQLWPPL